MVGQQIRGEKYKTRMGWGPLAVYRIRNSLRKCLDLLSICQLVNGILVAGLPPAANSACPENEENTQAWVARAVSGAGAAGGGDRRIWPHSRDVHHGGSCLRANSRHHRRLFPDRLLQINAETMFVIQPRIVRIVFRAP